MHNGLATLGNSRRNIFGSVFMPGAELPRIQIEEEYPGQIAIHAQLPNAPEPGDGTLLSAVMSAIANANPVSQELQEQKARIFAEASEILSRWDKFLEAAQKERSDELTRLHREVRERGRAQVALCEKLAGEFADADLAWNGARSVQAHAHNTVTQAVLDERHIGRFASDAEINKAAVRVANAKIKAEEASSEYAAAQQHRNEIANREMEAQKGLSAIAAEEIRLRAAISGASFVDPETGLSVPAGG